jgi:hypothetical protein
MANAIHSPFGDKFNLAGDLIYGSCDLLLTN